MLDKGAYCLCIQVKESITVGIGALGKTEFDKGFYIYIGSALNGLQARLVRHLKNSRGKHNVTHWHIDYLLREKPVEITKIVVQYSSLKTECFIAEQVSKFGEAYNGFGCSDCKCKSHLFKVKNCDFLYNLGLEEPEQNIFSLLDTEMVA